MRLQKRVNNFRRAYRQVTSKDQNACNCAIYIATKSRSTNAQWLFPVSLVFPDHSELQNFHRGRARRTQADLFCLPKPPFNPVPFKSSTATRSLWIVRPIMKPFLQMKKYDAHFAKSALIDLLLVWPVFDKNPDLSAEFKLESGVREVCSSEVSILFYVI